MPESLANLNSAYQDLRDRYGADDPTVLDLKSELERLETRPIELPFEDRRKSGVVPHVWNRRSHKRRPPLLLRDSRAFTVLMEHEELPDPIHIGMFAGSLLHSTDWKHQ